MNGWVGWLCEVEENLIMLGDIYVVLRLLQFEWWREWMVRKYVPVGLGIFFGLCLCGHEFWAGLG